jgi:hypothetical protein
MSDFEVIEAFIEARPHTTTVFTGQRALKHGTTRRPAQAKKYYFFPAGNGAKML